MNWRRQCIASGKYAAYLACLAAAAETWIGLELWLAFPMGGGITHYLGRRLTPVTVSEGIRFTSLLALGTVAFVIVARCRTWQATLLMAIASTGAALGFSGPKLGSPLLTIDRLQLLVLGLPFLPVAVPGLVLGSRAGAMGVAAATNLALWNQITWYLSWPHVGPRVRVAVVGVGILATIVSVWLSLIAPRANPETRRTSHPVPAPR